MKQHRDYIFEYEMLKKNKFIAYLLGAFFSVFGLHRLYLGDYVGGCTYLGLLLLTFFIPQVIFLIWLLMFVDLFYTWYLCDEYNSKLYKRLSGTGL